MKLAVFHMCLALQHPRANVNLRQDVHFLISGKSQWVSAECVRVVSGQKGSVSVWSVAKLSMTVTNGRPLS